MRMSAVHEITHLLTMQCGFGTNAGGDNLAIKSEISGSTSVCYSTLKILLLSKQLEIFHRFVMHLAYLKAL